MRSQHRNRHQRLDGSQACRKRKQTYCSAHSACIGMASTPCWKSARPAPAPQGRSRASGKGVHAQAVLAKGRRSDRDALKVEGLRRQLHRGHRVGTGCWVKARLGNVSVASRVPGLYSRGFLFLTVHLLEKQYSYVLIRPSPLRVSIRTGNSAGKQNRATRLDRTAVPSTPRGRLPAHICEHSP